MNRVPLIRPAPPLNWTAVWCVLALIGACSPVQVPRAVPIATDTVVEQTKEPAQNADPQRSRAVDCDTPGLEGFLGEPSRPVDLLWNVILTDPECLGYARKRKPVDLFEQRKIDLDATIDKQLREQPGKKTP